MKRNTRRQSPAGRHLPPGGVYLVCTDTGDWVGDILDLGIGRGPIAGRYHVGLVDTGCKASHRHSQPADHQVIAKMAQARRQQTSIPLRVLPIR